MREFLSSKKLSYFCFILNVIFAIVNFAYGNLVPFLVSLIFAIICLHDYKRRNDD